MKSPLTLSPRTVAAAEPVRGAGRRQFLQTAAAALTVGTLRPVPPVFADERDSRDHDREHDGGRQWVTSWAGSAHGLYPTGTAVAQPDLSFAFPNAPSGASDQTFRLIVRPTLWSDRFRLRFSNFFGTQAVTLDDVYLGLAASAGVLVSNTNRRVTFAGGGPSGHDRCRSARLQRRGRTAVCP
jgi:hypothetical protein